MPLRTHTLHTIALTGAPLDGGEDAEEDDGAAGGKRRAADLQLFHAGGACLDRVVLYYALTHFQRRLDAGLRRKVKQALCKGCR